MRRDGVDGKKESGWMQTTTNGNHSVTDPFYHQRESKDALVN
jgi:hypothetical protein